MNQLQIRISPAQTEGIVLLSSSSSSSFRKGNFHGASVAWPPNKLLPCPGISGRRRCDSRSKCLATLRVFPFRMANKNGSRLFPEATKYQRVGGEDSIFVWCNKNRSQPYGSYPHAIFPIHFPIHMQTYEFSYAIFPPTFFVLGGLNRLNIGINFEESLDLFLYKNSHPPRKMGMGGIQVWFISV